MTLRSSGLIEVTAPYSMLNLKELTLSTSSYEGKAYLVTDRIKGNPFYKDYPGIPLFLVGIFIGIELAPRFTAFRTRENLYYELGGSFFVMQELHINDASFEGYTSPYGRLWRL